MKNKRIVFILSLIIASFLIFYFYNILSKHKIFHGTQIFYTSAVTVDNVEKLGNFLVETGFTDGTRKSIQLDKKGNTYVFRMVVNKNAVQDKETLHVLKLFAANISKYCFNNANVEMHLCDEQFFTLLVLSMNG